MPIHSRWKIPIPVCSLQAYLFGSETSPLLDKIAYYDAERPETLQLTLNDFRLYSLRLAAGLQKAGLKPGDRVLLFSGNNLFFPVAFLGILMAGGIFTGANPTFVARELAYQLKDSDAKFLLCSDSSLEIGVQAAESIGLSKSQVFVFDDEVFSGHGKERLGVKHWGSLIESEEVGSKFKWVEPKDPKDQTCCLNYSSGTTGVPKGVMITHYNYVANAVQYGFIATLSPLYEERLKIAKGLCFLPMYHAYAQTIFIAVNPKRGVPCYIMKKFDFVQMLENVQKYSITSLVMVPPIVVALAKSPLSKKYDLSTVNNIGSGAAPLSGEVIEECEALWPKGDIKMKQGWGMTEATCSILGWDPTLTSIPSSVGELNANASAKIMSLDGKREVDVGERGEIWVMAPNIMKGYWRNEKATNEIFINDKDGRWMKTGDIAYLTTTKPHYFFIVDRLKELIKVKGNQVAPAELEGLLLEHPKIDDAAVVGVTINGEEVPRAYVVGKEGVTEKDVKEWVEKRASRYKWLTGGVVFLKDGVPKNPSGKILRAILRERAKHEVGDKALAKARL